MLPKSSYYHLCSEGTASDLLFRNAEEFRSGMNLVAISSFQTNVNILAFCIMNNHFHFILQASEDDVQIFAREISRCYKSRFSKKTEDSDPVLTKIKWDSYLIDSQRYLLASIAYVLKNPVTSFYEQLAVDYEWSSAGIYFRDERIRSLLTAGCRRYGDYRISDSRILLNSRVRLPDDWLITPSGYIWPGSYVDVKLVEREFRRVKVFTSFLFFNKEDEVTQMMMQSKRICISDIEMRAKIKEITKRKYGRESIRELSVRQRREMADEINSQLGCGYKQLFRLLHITLQP